jgi:hypothetical protein
MVSSLETNAAPPTTLGSNSRRQIYAYIAVLMTLTAFCDPNSGLMDIPVSFILKNAMRFDATQVSQFRFAVSIPLFLSFLFGLARDNWSPFGLGDRGHLLVFSILSAATYLLFALISYSTAALFLTLFCLTMWSLFIAGAQNGLTATLGDQHAMTGQMSTVWNLSTALPAILAFLIGGKITDFLQGLDAEAASRDVFLIGAAASCVLLGFSTLRAHPIYDHVRRSRQDSPFLERPKNCSRPSPGPPSPPHLGALELRAGIGNSSAILPSGCSRRYSWPMGTMERGLHGLVRPALFAVWLAVVAIERAVLAKGRNTDCDTAIHAPAVHQHAQNVDTSGCSHGNDGRVSNCCLSGADARGAPWPPRHNDDVSKFGLFRLYPLGGFTWKCSVRARRKLHALHPFKFGNLCIDLVLPSITGLRRNSRDVLLMHSPRRSVGASRRL